MKAVVCTRYGSPDVLQFQDVDKPTPGDHDLLVQVYATTVSSGDYSVRTFSVPPGLSFPSRLALGFSKPKKSILGMEFAGRVEAIGQQVSLFNVGDQVFGYSGVGFGAHAEYLSFSETGAVALKPADISYAEAASIPHGALAALYFLRDQAKIKSDDKVLINGASGAVGVAAVQIAKVFDAQVTAVCGTDNIAFMKSLGADEVIDYKREDFIQRDDRYDIIFDAVSKRSFAQCQNSLNEKGRYVLTRAGLPHYIHSLWRMLLGGKQIIGGSATEHKDDLLLIKQWIEEKKLKPVIDCEYSFEEIVDAHRYVEKGDKTGSVVVKVKSSP